MSDTTASKTPQKPNKRAPRAKPAASPGRASSSAIIDPAVKKAQSVLDKLQTALASERQKKALLNEKLKAAKAKAVSSGRKVDKNAVVRAQAAVARANEKLRDMRGKAHSAKIDLTISKAQAKTSEAGAEHPMLEQKAAVLSQKADADFTKAAAEFEAQWRKKRAAEDAAKLQKLAKRLKAKSKPASVKGVVKRGPGRPRKSPIA